MPARARGLTEAWHPRVETWELLCRIKQVLDEYVEQLPLTLRQIFYILVGRHAYEKTERAYERLCETLNKARRAKVVDMDSVRDDEQLPEADIEHCATEAMNRWLSSRANRFRSRRDARGRALDDGKAP
jgi:hypothetical protein